jgi:hypothetical protein
MSTSITAPDRPSTERTQPNVPAAPPAPTTPAAAAAATTALSRHDLLPCALILLAWTALALLVGVAGEFPLNDDFAYARAVQLSLEHGRIMRIDWTWVPLVTHTLIGLAFSSVLGFSFATLRVANLSMGALGLVATYVLCRRAGASPKLSALAALLLAFNPLYFNLAYTFMTDISFLALVLLAILALDAALTRDSWRWLLLGLALAVAATLCRQLGLMVAAGFAATLVLRAPLSIRNWSIAVAFVAINLAAYVLVPHLAYGNLRGSVESDAFFAKQLVSRQSVAAHTTFAAARNLIYLGLFLSPLAFLLLRGHLRDKRRTLLGASLLAAFGAVAAILALRLRLPSYNTISNVSLGPLISQGTTSLPHVPKPIWWLLSVAGAAAAAVLVSGLLTFLWQHRRSLLSERPLLVIIIFAAAAYSVPAFVLGKMDRYALPLLPLAAVAVACALSSARSPARPFTPPNVGFLLLLALCSAAATRDYRTRIDANWRLATDLHATGVATDRINAAFEFNAFHNFGDPRCRLWAKGPFVIDDEYIVSYAPQIDGYALASQRTYHRLLPPGKETVNLFKRTGPAAAAAAAVEAPQRDPSSAANSEDAINTDARNHQP